MAEFVKSVGYASILFSILKRSIVSVVCYLLAALVSMHRKGWQSREATVASSECSTTTVQRCDKEGCRPVKKTTCSIRVDGIEKTMTRTYTSTQTLPSKDDVIQIYYHPDDVEKTATLSFFPKKLALTILLLVGSANLLTALVLYKSRDSETAQYLSAAGMMRRFRGDGSEATVDMPPHSRQVRHAINQPSVARAFRARPCEGTGRDRSRGTAAPSW